MSLNLWLVCVGAIFLCTSTLAFPSPRHTTAVVQNNNHNNNNHHYHNLKNNRSRKNRDSANAQQGRGQGQHQLRSDITRSTSSLSMAKSPSSNNNNNHSRINRFLKRLYQGMTFPFPSLYRFRGGGSSVLQQVQRSVSSSNSTTTTTTTTDIPSSSSSHFGFSLREALSAIVIYLVVGAIVYDSKLIPSITISDNTKHTIPSWINSLYFSVVTFTTVGYGDLTPVTNISKLFTIVFGLIGISLLGVAIATIGNKLVETEQEMIQIAKQESRKQLSKVFSTLGTNTNNSTPDSETSTTTTTSGTIPKWSQTIVTFLRKSIPSIALIMMGGIGMGYYEHWNWKDGIYYAFITAGTLGYGDYSPQTKYGRLLGIFFIPLSVAAAGNVLGNIATAILERKQSKYYYQLLHQPLNVQRLTDMDTNTDGQVSREEYVTYMLQELNLVDQEQLNELYLQFDKLDVDGGGYLDQYDLQLKLNEIQNQKTKPSI